MDHLDDEDYVDFDFPDEFKVTDTIDEIIEKYNSLYEITERLDEVREEKLDGINNELSKEFENAIEQLQDLGIINNTDEIKFNEDEDVFHQFVELVKSVPEDEDKKEKVREIFNDLLVASGEREYYDLTKMSNFELKLSGQSLKQYIDDDTYKVSQECVQSIFIKEEGSFIGKDNVGFEIEISDHSKTNAYEYFFEKGFIDNIYYFDNVSIFDLYLSNSDFKNVILRHTDEFINELFEDNDDETSDESIKCILEKIENIIGGKYSTLLLPIFHTDKIDNSAFSEHFPQLRKVTTSSDTPSGIKQMGILQLLLSNNKLRKGDYLIIDEPEINLHPEWQFKFAEILVLLAKLDIIIYINSHSPLLIESIAAFSEFYDMENDVNYYLTEPSEDEGKYNFVKINSDEIFRVYDNLGNAYDLIDQLRLKKRLGE